MGSKVLLADDSITIQKVVAIIFSNEDYELTVVDNGDDALLKAREIIPDIMLVDALMPGKNGYEVCQEVRRDPVLKNVPLLLMTGAFEPFDEDKARQCGADDFISKPFESQSLIDVANKLVLLGEERQKGGAVSAPPVMVPVEPELTAWAEPSDVGFAEETEFAEPPSFEGASAIMEEVTASPAVAPQPLDVSTDDDLWGVFNLEEASDVESVAVENQTAAGEAEEFAMASPDEAFAFAEEEPIVPVSAAKDAVHGAGFEPFGEQEFSFDETPIDTAAAFAVADAVAADPNTPVVTYGEVASPPAVETAPIHEPDELAFLSESFAETVAITPEPAVEPVAFAEESFAEPAAFVAEPAAPIIPDVESFEVPEPAAPVVATSTAIPAAVTFDENMLKDMLAKISREVIEKIIWEVVPDLAEILIKEEIKKLKASTAE